jgi:hypothetical protein
MEDKKLIRVDLRLSAAHVPFSAAGSNQGTIHERAGVTEP